MSQIYEAVIGLEIHAQLKTNSKMFSPDGTSFDGADNCNTSTVSLGMPGALPVVNHAAIEFSIKAGLALGCEIRPVSVFARKNYFYPDLPKGYQISQYDKPICEFGSVDFFLEGKKHTVSITRAHMEEDAGKSTHFAEYSLINFNRSGVPLLEIVSGPDMRTPAEAAQYARTVRAILRYLDVCDGNLEEGSLRCDCNVSVRPTGQEKFGTKVEIKNINSFRFIEKAIEYEIERQTDLALRGEKIIQETRLWDPDKSRTFSMRTKEDAQDYRYFPDPDLLPVRVTSQMVEKIRASLPELPLVRKARFMTQLGLPEYDADILTGEKELADYFEAALQSAGAAKPTSNWIMTELLRELNQAGLTIEKSPISASALGDLVKQVESGAISGKTGKGVFLDMWKSGKTAAEIIKEKGLVQVSDTAAIEKWVDEVIAANPGPVAEYRAGKTKLLGFFVGLVMKNSKGQANPDAVNQILTARLKA